MFKFLILLILPAVSFSQTASLFPESGQKLVMKRNYDVSHMNNNTEQQLKSLEVHIENHSEGSDRQGLEFSLFAQDRTGTNYRADGNCELKAGDFICTNEEIFSEQGTLTYIPFFTISQKGEINEFYFYMNNKKQEGGPLNNAQEVNDKGAYVEEGKVLLLKDIKANEPYLLKEAKVEKIVYGPVIETKLFCVSEEGVKTELSKKDTKTCLDLALEEGRLCYQGNPSIAAKILKALKLQKGSVRDFGAGAELFIGLKVTEVQYDSDEEKISYIVDNTRKLVGEDKAKPDAILVEVKECE